MAVESIPVVTGVPVPGTPEHADPPVPARKVKGIAGERKPIIAEPWRKENRKHTVRRIGGLHWYLARFHGARAHIYIPSTIWWAAAGVLALAWKQSWWGWDVPAKLLENEAVATGNIKDYLAVSKHGDKHRKARLITLGIEIAVLGGVIATYTPWWVWVLLLAAIIPVLAHIGRPADKPIVKRAIVPPQYEKPTPAIIERALGALQITQISNALKDGGHLTFITDVYESGPGWGCQLDLPFGVTPSMILSKREQFASGLRRPLSATWPASVPHEHEGRLDIWIGFSDLAKMKKPAHPLLKSGTGDVFGEVPFGTSPRAQKVTTGLFELNWLIGAAPGQGKSNALRVLACPAALDVVCDIWTHEFSGKGDLEPLARISHRYVGGLDDEAIEYGAHSMALLKQELDRRSKLFKKLDRRERPDGKLTRELAGKKGSRLRPIVAIFDEVQNLFMHPEYGGQAAADAAYVIRLGRAYGIIIVLATQRPDKDSLPTAVSGIVTARFCLQVPDQVSNDMILGTGAYKAGYKTTVFRPRTDAGMGWLKAEGTPQIVMTYYVDLNDLEKIVTRARVMREQAGVLSGYAIDETDETEAERDVLADVRSIFGTDDKLQWADLADRLAERYPRWSDVTADAISAQLRDLGIPSRQVWSGGKNRQGCWLSDLVLEPQPA